MKQKLKMVSLKVEPHQAEALKKVALLNKESQSALLRRWIDSELASKILEIVSDLGEDSIEVRADYRENFVTHHEQLDSEFISFNLEIGVWYEYEEYDPETGFGNVCNVTKTEVTLLQVLDEAGEVHVHAPLRKRIEKEFNKRLSIDIFEL